MTAERITPTNPLATEVLGRVAGAQVAYEMLFDTAWRETQEANIPGAEFGIDFYWSQDEDDPYREDPDEPVVVLVLKIEDRSEGQEVRFGLWKSITTKYGAYLNTLDEKTKIAVGEAISFSLDIKKDL